MNINDIVAKFTRQHDRGLITSEDYLAEVEKAVAELRYELTGRFTMNIIVNNVVTESFVEYTYGEMVSIIENEICPSVFGCSDDTCPSKWFARALKANGVATYLKRDEDGYAAHHVMYTAHRI